MGLRLFRHDYSGQATKDKVAVTWLILQRMPLVRCEIEIIMQVFVANLLRFAEMNRSAVCRPLEGGRDQLLRAAPGFAGPSRPGFDGLTVGDFRME